MAVAKPQDYLADLNPAQREAVLTTEGPLLVIVPAQGKHASSPTGSPT
jgi:hypothetical protein